MIFSRQIPALEGPLDIPYDPAPVVCRFIEDWSFVTGYFGPLGCGKTTGGCMKAWMYGQAFPGARIAVIRDTWPNLRDTTQTTFFKWFPEGAAGNYVRTTKTYYLYVDKDRAPVEILFRAMDDKRDISNVLSLDLASAWIDEPQGGLALKGRELVSDPGIDRELFLSILGRCGRQGPGYPRMAWMTGNPPSKQHWIAKEFRYPGHGIPKNPRPKLRLYLGDQETNRDYLPHNYYEDLEEFFGHGTPIARRFLRGEWVDYAQLNPFREEWIAYWDQRPDPKGCFIVLAVDPAISKKDGASRSALVAVGQPRQGPDKLTTYVLKAVAGHWTPYELAGHILAIVEEFPVRRLRIEDVAWQRALADIVRKEADTKGIRLPYIDLIKPETDKLRRALGASPLVESGRVLFGPGQRDLVDSLLAVPGDASGWDLTDAFGLALSGLPKTRADRTSLEEHKDAGIRQRVVSYAVKTPRATEAQPIPLPPGRHPRGQPAVIRPSSGKDYHFGYAGPRPGNRDVAEKMRKRARGYAMKTRNFRLT